MSNQVIEEKSSVKDSLTAAVMDSGNRKAAPEVSYGPELDQRKAQLDYLDKKDPDFVHMYQRREVTDWELQTKGQEIVRNAQGEVMHSNGDPVVRVSRKREMSRREKEAARSVAAVEAVVKPENSVVFRSPQRPSVRKRTKSESVEDAV